MEIIITILFIWVIGTIIAIGVIANKVKNETKDERNTVLNNLKNNVVELSSKKNGVMPSSQDLSKQRNIYLMIFGIIIIIFSALMTYFSSVEIKFSCNRINNMCSREEINLISQKKKFVQMNLSDLRNSRSNQMTGGKGSHPYNVILETSGGDIKLLNIYKLNSIESSNMVNKINTFINSQQESLEIIDSNPLTIWSFFYITIGILLIFLSRRKK